MKYRLGACPIIENLLQKSWICAIFRFFSSNRAILLLIVTISSDAKVSVSEQSRLANDLTPFGAQRSGNGAEIPAWNGEDHANLDEKPLIIISHENMQKHAEQLTAGQKALLTQYPSFEMPIYATHRTAIAPQWVYENTAKNALNANLNAEKTGVQSALAGIPFPIPQSALEVYFNHISRWRGQQIKNRASDAVVYKKGNFTLFTRQTIARFDGYIEKTNSPYFVSLVAKILAPANKSGGGILVREPLDQLHNKRLAWSWDKGRRRTIRAPNIAYDNPVTSASSLRTVDDADLINGSPDRFYWELLPKQDIYVPYNNLKLSDKKLKYSDILKPYHINPKLSRYELHRVWVLQATLKAKWRHVYSKRIFYIDEDSWQVLAADQYNKQGQLWRVSLSYPKFYPQMPGIFPVINVFHDLKSQKYHVMGLQNEEDAEIEFNGELAKDSLFTPSGFKRYMR